MKIDRHHTVHYLFLLTLMGVSFTLLALVPLTKTQQLNVVLATAGAYICYGIFHHKVHHDLSVKIVIEYAMVGMLVVALFLFVRGGI